MKKLYTLFLLMVAVLLPITANAYDFMVDGICYFINSDSISVRATFERETMSLNSIAYLNIGSSLIIPESVSYNGKTYAVIAIGDLAFANCTGFTGSLTIPNSVTTIGNYAFYGCSGITDITIPSGLADIGGDAFDGTAWYDNQPDGVVYISNVAYRYKGNVPSGSTLTLRDGIKGIAGSAFRGCVGFTGSLTIPNSVTTIGNSAFSGCSGFTGSLTIPNSVITIGIRAFNGCSGFTGSLTIPNSVISIGNFAFCKCSGFTGSLTIGNSVTSIGNDAFYGCEGFTGLNWNAKNCNSMGGLPTSQIEWVKIGNQVEIIPDYFVSSSHVTGQLLIPNSVTSIGEWAFNNCSGFTGSLTIPNSVTSIGDYAFRDCSGFMGSLTIPNSVTSIGNGAFSCCYGFTGSLTIPNSVTTIGGWAFADCSGFTGSLTIPNSVTSIGDLAFQNCSGLNTLTLTGNGKCEEWPLKGIETSQIKTLNVGSGVTELGGLEFTPEVVNSYAEAPPTCAETTFTNYDAALHVPTSSTVVYFTAPYWTNFGNIVNDIKEKMSIDQTEASLTVSEKLQLKATATPSSMNNEIMWCSSNPTVAKVDENGLVTSVSQGECDIFAYLSSIPAVYASCHIGSRPGIILDISQTTITPNQILTLTPKYDSAETDITATSSNTGVAIARVVMVDGVKKVQVVGVALGTATITVAGTNDTYRPATCVVTVAAQRSGDVNGDGKVDVEDVNAVINIILELKTAGDYTGNADVTGDGKVDVEDVNAIINIILSN